MKSTPVLLYESPARGFVVLTQGSFLAGTRYAVFNMFSTEFRAAYLQFCVFKFCELYFLPYVYFATRFETWLIPMVI